MRASASPMPRGQHQAGHAAGHGWVVVERRCPAMWKTVFCQVLYLLQYIAQT